MHPIEKFLVSIDSPPFYVFRVALGLILAPALSAFSDKPHELASVIGLFIGTLLAVRGVPAVIRRILPFSAEAKDIWAERRSISRHYDSYQWRKLFWIGLGMLPYSIASGGAGNGVFVVTLFCLIGGCAGLIVWQRVSAAQRRALGTKATTNSN